MSAKGLGSPVRGERRDRFCSPQSKARRSGAFRTAAGLPVAVVKADPSTTSRLNWPVFLPDGHRFLYLQRRVDGSGRLMLAEPGVPHREVRSMLSNAGYVAPGYLVFAAEGALLAQRFDASTGTVSGAPFSVAEQVRYFLTTSVAAFATSLGGTLGLPGPRG